MKPLLSLFVIASLSAACGKPAAPAPAATAAPAPSAAAGQAAAPEVTAAKPIPAELPAVIARVNGEVIGRLELESAIRAAETRVGASIPPDQRDAVVRGLIDQLVAYHLLAQEARARKIDVPDADVEARVDEIRKGFPDEDTFAKALSAEGTSLEELRQETRVGLQVAKVLDMEVDPNVSVPQKDIEAFYQQNPDRFKEGESVRASHILIAVADGADAAQKQGARAKAESTLKLARSGADFAQLARKQSEDPVSAAKGGELGFFPKGQMDATFEAAAFSLKPGALSDVVETTYGFHIIKLLERRPPRTVPFAEVSPQIRQFLIDQQHDQRTGAYVARVRARSKVEILV